MSRATTALFLVIATALPIVASAPSNAAADTPVRDPGPPVPMTWTDPPETVRSGVQALRKACAAWTQQLPMLAPALGDHLRPPEADVCNAALQREGDAYLPMLLGALVAAFTIGLFGGSYVLFSRLSRAVWDGGSVVARAAWSRRPGRWRGA